ncbi:hypothetical protein HPB51_017479 [Rhipicephalus microplus]|uniref:BHLH domain-containing protein n=1 Tax=Rhipicephalus microplus TaxID=6941 RepID=A0A9J6F607_RHIMP|nr:hypothetical protein HPB51_017479 [Rhipicephalus microplus]
MRFQRRGYLLSAVATTACWLLEQPLVAVPPASSRSTARLSIKRRQDEMNMYISEMAFLVPMCKAIPRKLDKLTVLVQHI